MIFYCNNHMKPHGCRHPLLPSKNPHLIRTLIKSRKKRNEFFIVASTLVATTWLLMLGNFETLGSKFSNETRFCEAACVLYYYIKKSIFRPLQEKRPSIAWPSNYFSRNYFLVSLKTTCLRNFGEYFFNSKRSGLLRLFLLVKYKRSPVSAHSNKMLIRMNDTSHFQIDSITHRFFYDLPVYNNKILDTCQWLYNKFQIILLGVKFQSNF